MRFFQRQWSCQYISRNSPPIPCEVGGELLRFSFSLEWKNSEAENIFRLAMRIAQERVQPGHNIRKIRVTRLKKIQKKLLDYLQSGQRSPQELTLNNKQFMERNKKAPS